MLELIEQGLMEPLALIRSPGLQLAAFLPLLLKAALRLRVPAIDTDATPPRQLEHSLLKREALPLLQPADGIGALAADKAVHAVALRAHRQRRATVVVPGAAGNELPPRLAQFGRVEQIRDARPLTHLLQQRRGEQSARMATGRTPASSGSQAMTSGSAAAVGAWAGHQRHSTPG